MDHPDKNKFAPTKIPELCKDAHGGNWSTQPYILYKDEKTVAWFKQDDTFDQPFVWSRVEILCSDIDIKKDLYGKAFIILWIEMIKENCRETNYNASEAGVK